MTRALAEATGARPSLTAGAEASAAPSAARDYLSLVKPRITLLVLVTAAAGYYLGSPGAVEVTGLLHLLVGTALVASGTSAMNQVLERDVDGRMERTRDRPLPAGRLRAAPAAAFAGGLSVAGTVYLAATTNLLTAGLAGACFLVYDLVYTPLKRVHPLSTLVGAVPGALPAAGGWTAATGRLDAGALTLFGILFLWQLPHFLALAWLFRDQYRAAGLRMLSVEDPGGSRTRHHALTYAIVLLPVSLLPASLGIAGAAYAVCAVGLGGLFILQAARFFRSASRRSAGRLFRYSVLYLPLLLGVLALDKAPPAARAAAAPSAPPAFPALAAPWTPAERSPAAGTPAARFVGGIVAARGREARRRVEGLRPDVRGTADRDGRGGLA